VFLLIARKIMYSKVQTEYSHMVVLQLLIVTSLCRMLLWTVGLVYCCSMILNLKFRMWRQK